MIHLLYKHCNGKVQCLQVNSAAGRLPSHTASNTITYTVPAVWECHLHYTGHSAGFKSGALCHLWVGRLYHSRMFDTFDQLKQTINAAVARTTMLHSIELNASQHWIECFTALNWMLYSIEACASHYLWWLSLGRLPKVDLIILEGGKMSVRTSVRPSVHKKFLRFQWNLVYR